MKGVYKKFKDNACRKKTARTSKISATKYTCYFSFYFSENFFQVP